LLFIFLSSFTVLNMLIGIVCEVVSNVSKHEKAEEEARFLKNNLMNILDCYDKDEDQSIGPEEFTTFFNNPEVQNLLGRFGTKVGGILSLKPVLFEQTDKLTFPELLDTIMRLRGENKAEVTDIMELREFIRQCNAETKQYLRKYLGGEAPMETTDSTVHSAFLSRGTTLQISSPMASAAADTTDAASWEAISERIDRIESMCLARKESDEELRARLEHLEQVLQRLAEQFGGAEADIT